MPRDEKVDESVRRVGNDGDEDVGYRIADNDAECTHSSKGKGELKEADEESTVFPET